MSYKNELQNNNVDLQSILEAVNNLPEAGSGGSGGSTANVTVSAMNGTTFKYIGEDSLVTITNLNSTVKMAVPSICLATSGTMFANVSASGNSEILYNNGYVAVFHVTGDATIYADANVGSGGSP